MIPCRVISLHALRERGIHACVGWPLSAPKHLTLSSRVDIPISLGAKACINVALATRKH